MKYKYEMWNRSTLIGTISINTIANGRYLVIPFISKGIIEEIKLPIRIRIIGDDGIDLTYRRVLDVSRKSKRQIDLLKGYSIE